MGWSAPRRGLPGDNLRRVSPPDPTHTASIAPGFTMTSLAECPALVSQLNRDPSLAECWAGADLRSWRKTLRVSQEALAERLDVSRSYLSKLETGCEDTPLPRWLVYAVAGCEGAFRRAFTRDKERRRRRVKARQRRRRERHEDEERRLREERGLW